MNVNLPRNQNIKMLIGSGKLVRILDQCVCLLAKSIKKEITYLGIYLTIDKKGHNLAIMEFGSKSVKKMFLGEFFLWKFSPFLFAGVLKTRLILNLLYY